MIELYKTIAGLITFFAMLGGAAQALFGPDPPLISDDRNLDDRK